MSGVKPLHTQIRHFQKPWKFTQNWENIFTQFKCKRQFCRLMSMFWHEILKILKEILKTPEQRFPYNLWRRPWWSRLAPAAHEEEDVRGDIHSIAHRGLCTAAGRYTLKKAAAHRACIWQELWHTGAPCWCILKFLKDCTPGEDLWWSSSWRIVACGKDPTGAVQEGF